MLVNQPSKDCPYCPIAKTHTYYCKQGSYKITPQMLKLIHCQSSPRSHDKFILGHAFLSLSPLCTNPRKNSGKASVSFIPLKTDLAVVHTGHL